MEKNLQLAWAVAKVLREAREASGLTQRQLAEFAGISETYISFIEHAHIKASINALVQIAPVVSMETSELMRRIEEEMKRGPRAPKSRTGRPRKTCVKT